MLRSRGVLPLSGAAQETMKSVDKKLRDKMKIKARRAMMSIRIIALEAIAVGWHVCACIVLACKLAAGISESRHRTDAFGVRDTKRSNDHMSSMMIKRSNAEAQCRNTVRESLRIQGKS